MCAKGGDAVRQLWFATGLLVGMILLVVWGSGWMMDTMTPMVEELTQTSDAVREGNWDRAEQTVQGMLDHWESVTPRLHLFQPHDDVDEVSALLREAQMALIFREADQYAAASVRLVGALEKLCAMERFSLENLF